ncbi:MAG: YiaA/YiaB family inner membrane protein [Anaerolineae bacterium]
MKNVETIQQDSPAWRLFVVISFMLSLGATSLGLMIMPVDLWVKGYLAMGLYFTVSSTFILSKTIRDSHEAGKLINKLSEARAEKMLKEFELNP